MVLEHRAVIYFAVADGAALDRLEPTILEPGEPVRELAADLEVKLGEPAFLDWIDLVRLMLPFGGFGGLGT